MLLLKSKQTHLRPSEVLEENFPVTQFPDSLLWPVKGAVKDIIIWIQIELSISESPFLFPVKLFIGSQAPFQCLNFNAKILFFLALEMSKPCHQTLIRVTHSCVWTVPPCGGSKHFQHCAVLNLTWGFLFFENQFKDLSRSCRTLMWILSSSYHY